MQCFPFSASTECEEQIDDVTATRRTSKTFQLLEHKHQTLNVQGKRNVGFIFTAENSECSPAPSEDGAMSGMSHPCVLNSKPRVDRSRAPGPSSTKFCAGVPNICGSSEWNFHDVTYPVRRIFRSLVESLKICAILL